MQPFENVLSVCVENIEFEFRNNASAEWSNFLLNPRRLRGCDFLIHWSQGVWSEERITQAVNQTSEFFAIPYGPSGTAPDDDVRAFELYFERLGAAGFGKVVYWLAGEIYRTHGPLRRIRQRHCSIWQAGESLALGAANARKDAIEGAGAVAFLGGGEKLIGKHRI